MNEGIPVPPNQLKELGEVLIGLAQLSKDQKKVLTELLKVFEDILDLPEDKKPMAKFFIKLIRTGLE